MTLLEPAFLLVLVPLGILWYSVRNAARPVQIARGFLLLLLALLAAGPAVRRASPGTDVVVVADRSLSIAPAEKLRQEEIIRLLAEKRGKGDRLGLVVFGRNGLLAAPPQAAGIPGISDQGIDPEGSDLAAALRLASAAIPVDRAGKVVVLSDGRFTGASPLQAAAWLRNRGIPVDFVHLESGLEDPAALQDLILPRSVWRSAVFRLAVPVIARRPMRATVTVFRDGTPIGAVAVSLREGLQEIPFYDRLKEPGIHTYSAVVEVPGDRRPENNRALGAVRVVGPSHCLIVNADGGEDDLTEALKKGDLPVKVIAPSQFPTSLEQLSETKAVVFEDVPLTEFPPGADALIARFITELGGGFILTGGRHSFGLGGYFRSNIDPLLPLSMEIRRKYRRFSTCVVIALDRSGSMAVPVGGGLRKMDLANMGACAAIELLTGIDQVAVVAVDSEAHLVVPLTDVERKAPLLSLVRRIDSMGGGIMTDIALEVGASLLARSDRAARHLILFADAADAEEQKPGRCAELTEILRKIGASVTVIGLGTRTDATAELLTMIARKTEGQVYFVRNPRALPQIFGLATMQVLKSGYAEEKVQGKTLPDLNLIFPVESGLEQPAFDGFNVTVLRPEANLGLIGECEETVPLFAFWRRGAGRVAAFAAAASGTDAKTFLSWAHYDAFMVSLLRFAARSETEGVYVRAVRRGNRALVEVEVDPNDQKLLEALTEAQLVVSGVEGGTLQLQLKEVEAGKFIAEFPFDRKGIHLTTLVLPDGKVVRGPPLCLPYSPEFEPLKDPQSGYRVLRLLAEQTGGTERITWDGVYSGGGGRAAPLLLLVPFLIALLAGHVLEVALRRLGPPRISLPPVVGVALEKAKKAALKIRLPHLRRGRKAAPEGKAHQRASPEPQARERRETLSPFEEAARRAARRFRRKPPAGE